MQAIAHTKAEADHIARRLVNGWTGVAATFGWPPGSMLVLAAMDAKIVHDVAKAYNVISYDVEEVTAAVGASMAGKVASGEALTFLPGPGWVLKSMVAAGTTKVLGEALIEHFRDRSSLA